MATLAELKQIQVDSTKPPVDELGDPQPQPVLDAIALLGKIEAALWKEITQRLAGTDPTFPPETPIEEQNRIRNEAIGWAQRSLSSTQSLAQEALKVFVAFRHDQPAGAILSSADGLIENSMNGLVPRLSQGFHPGRR
jgi:hypothetical protein